MKPEKQYIDIVNAVLKSKSVQDMDLLLNIFHNKEFIEDYKDYADLSYAFVILQIYELEKESNPEKFIYEIGNSIDEIGQIITDVRFMLWRIEFNNDKIAEDNLKQYVSRLKLSEAFMYVMLNTVCFDKNKMKVYCSLEYIYNDSLSQKKILACKEIENSYNENQKCNKNNHHYMIENEKQQDKKINSKKICFIMCTNDQKYLNEALYYINKLKVPSGYEIDFLSVTDAESMTSGYNEAMNATDADIKIYIHQDVFILNENILENIVDIFKDKSIGMIGMVGAKPLAQNATMWESNRVGKIYTSNIYNSSEFEFGKVDGEYETVDAVDGMFIATQIDIKWRDDIFDKWDFYDISQGFEFRKKGFKVVVPRMEKPWILHDDGVMNLANYDVEKEKFIKEYIIKYK